VGKKTKKKAARPLKAVAEPVTMEWKRWAALSLIDGQPLADIIDAMVADGTDEAAAAATCALFFDEDGGFEAARWTAQQLRKLESILTMRQELEQLGHIGDTVDRREGLGRDEFLEQYYARNTPVILTDVCRDWPARNLWTPGYLASVLGEAEVEVMSGRDNNPNYEREADDHRQVVAFATFAEQVKGTESNDTYLVANNEFLSSSVAEPLWSDFSADPRYLDPAQRAAYMWFGPAGTITPLHHDALSVLFNQVLGRKRFRLISPLATHFLYNNISVYSDVDPLAVDTDRFPLFEQARQITVTLEPGETLFVPVGWWHHVESLDVSISVSFTNFVFPNDIELFDPDIAL
jgi:ribosomal protein L16 Arg81 hydroxylase